MLTPKQIDRLNMVGGYSTPSAKQLELSDAPLPSRSINIQPPQEPTLSAAESIVKEHDNRLSLGKMLPDFPLSSSIWDGENTPSGLPSWIPQDQIVERGRTPDTIQNNPSKLKDYANIPAFAFWNLAEMFGRIGEGISNVPRPPFVGPKYGEKENINKWKDISDKFRKKASDVSPKTGALPELIGNVSSSITQSIATGLPPAVIGFMIGGPQGAALGYSAGGLAGFGLAEYSGFLADVEDDARAKGASEKEIQELRKEFNNKAILSGIAEGGFEALGNLTEAKLLGFFGKQGLEPIKKTFVKKLSNALILIGKQSGVEVSSEMATSAVENELRSQSGLDTPSNWEAAKSAVIPTLLQTAIMMGLGAGAKKRIDKGQDASFSAEEFAKQIEQSSKINPDTGTTEYSQPAIGSRELGGYPSSERNRMLSEVGEPTQNRALTAGQEFARQIEDSSKINPDTGLPFEYVQSARVSLEQPVKKRPAAENPQISPTEVPSSVHIPDIEQESAAGQSYVGGRKKVEARAKERPVKDKQSEEKVLLPEVETKLSSIEQTISDIKKQKVPNIERNRLLHSIQNRVNKIRSGEIASSPEMLSEIVDELKDVQAMAEPEAKQTKPTVPTTFTYDSPAGDVVDYLKPYLSPSQIVKMTHKERVDVANDANKLRDMSVRGQETLKETQPETPPPAETQPEVTHPVTKPPETPQISPETTETTVESPTEDISQQTPTVEAEKPSVDTVHQQARDIITSDESMATKTQRMRTLAKQNNMTEKQAEEFVESQIVGLANEQIKDKDFDSSFDELTDLYNKQPNFNKRTSGSIQRQAYSTPLPLGYAVNYMIDSASGKSIYEPTAGTGLLLVGLPYKNVSANEIDTERANSLRTLGIKEVTENDATEYVPKGEKDRIVMNPPFGSMEQNNYEGKYIIRRKDHLIALKALESLGKDGNAAMITGADMMESGKITGADKIFLNYLHNNFNVIDSFVVSGDLYKKQGASFPVLINVVSGRKENPTFEKLAPESVDVIKSYGELRERAKEVRNEIETRGNVVGAGQRSGVLDNTETENESTEHVSPVSGQGTGTVQPTSGTSDKGRTGDSAGVDKQQRIPGSGQKTPVSKGYEKPGLLSKPAERPTAGRPEPSFEGTEQQSGTIPEEEQQVSGKPERNGEVDAGNKPVEVSPKVSVPGGVKRSPRRISDHQVEYIPKSELSSIGTVITDNLSKSVESSLQMIEDEVNMSIDDYVMNKLQYKSKEELNNALSAEQIDGVAIAIYWIDHNGGAIIGDETGIGKGRQAAAVIRYSMLEGYFPVFFSADAKLFSDLYRDLRNIDTEFNPFLIGNKKNSTIVNEENIEIFKALSPQKQKEIMSNMSLEDYDCAFCTYSQINTENDQQKFFERLFDNRKTVLILDESHLASGDASMQGVFFRGGTIERGKGANKYEVTYSGLINHRNNKAVVYLSATFAKTPLAMPLYSRTDISNALDNIDDLVKIMSKGGLPLQELVSEALAVNGQFTRRERDFSGVEFKTSVVKPKTEQESSQLVNTLDNTTNALKEIVEFSKLVREAVSDLSEAKGTAQTEDQWSVSDFASTVHTKVSQLLLALRSEYVIDKAIESFKNGEKPVITLVNTQGSFIEELADEHELKDGDIIEDATFKNILLRSLERTLRVTEKDAGGESHVYYMTPEELGLQNEYEDVKSIIESLDIDVPLSPIDYITQKLTDAGMKVGEITARPNMLVYNNDGTVSYKTRKKPSKNIVVNDFNSGKLDVIILNDSGAQGLSLHAGIGSPDERPRRMFVIQPDLNIVMFMQKLGRIRRTGMVPGSASYELIILPVEAERRIASVLATKMKSLNASVTADSESGVSLDAVDILNKYGDRVASHYLSENTGLSSLLNMSIPVSDTGRIEVMPDTMRKMTGRMALLPNSLQKEIYNEIITLYDDYVKYLKDHEQYDLETIIHDDWSAELVDSITLHEGSGNIKSIFNAPTFANKYSINDTRVTPTFEEVMDEYHKNIGSSADEANAFMDSIIKELDEFYDKKYGDIPETTDEEKYKDFIKKGGKAKETWVKTTKPYLQYTLKDLIIKPLTLTIGEKGEETTYTGVITNVKISKKTSTNIGTPGNIEVDVMINSPIKTERLRLSQIISSGDISLSVYDRYSTGTSAQEQFNRENTIGRKRERWVLSGNLIRGYEYSETGKVVRFDTAEGKKITGVLMPVRWKPENLVRDPRRELSSGEAVVHYINNFLGWRNDAIMTPDGLSVTKSYGNLKITTPRAKRSGGKYFLDNGLIGIVGEFQSRGSRMEVYISEQQLINAVNYLIREKHEYFLAPTIKYDNVKASNDASKLPDLEAIGRVRVNYDRLNNKDIEKAFSWADETLWDIDGNFWWKKNGIFGTIEQVEYLTKDQITALVKAGKLNPGEVVSGYYQNGKITLTKYADGWTINHEHFHFLEKMGILNQREINAIDKHIMKTEGKTEVTHEDRAYWFTKELEKREIQRNTLLGRIIQKINDFIGAIVNIFTQTANGVVRNIETGQIYEKSGARDAFLKKLGIDTGISLEVKKSRRVRGLAKYREDILTKNEIKEINESVAATNKIMEETVTAEEREDWYNLANTEGKQPVNPLKQVRLATLIKNNISFYTKGYVAGTKETTERLTKLKKLISTYARKYLPQSDMTRGQVTPIMTAIANAKTPEQVIDAFNRIEDVRFRVTIKQLRESIETMLSKYQPKKISGISQGTSLDENSYALLHDIRKMTELSEDDAIKMIAVLKNKADKNSRELSDDEEEFIFRLQLFSDMKNRSERELQNILANIKQIVVDGRSLRKVSDLIRQNKINDNIARIVGIVSDGAGVLSEDEAREQKKTAETRSFFSKLKAMPQNYLTSTQYGIYDILDKLSKFDKTSSYGRSYLNTSVKELLRTAENAEETGRDAIDNILRKKYREIFGISKKGIVFNKTRQMMKVFRIQINNARIKNTGIYIVKGKKKTQIRASQNQLYNRWQAWHNPKLKETLSKMGYTDSIMKQIEDYLDPRVKAWAEWQMSTFFPAYYVRINKAYRERYHADLPFNEFYSIILRDVDDDEQRKSLLNMNDDVNATVLNYHLFNRRNSTSPLKWIDGDAELMRYIVDMEHFIAWANPIRDMRAIWNSSLVKKAIEQNFVDGREANKQIRNNINDLARGNIDPILRNKAVSYLSRSFAVAKIGFNMSMTPKQFSAFSAYAAYLPDDAKVSDFTKGIVDFMKHPIDRMRILSETAYIKDRYGAGWGREARLVLASTGKEQLNPLLKPSHALLFTSKLGDKASVMFGGWAIYKYYYDKTLRETHNVAQAKQVAEKEFAEATESTQQTGKRQYMSGLQAGGSYPSLLTLFQSAPNLYFRIESGAIRNLIARRGSVKANLRRLIIAHVILPQIFELMASLGRFDDERQLRALILGSLNGIFIFGDFLESLLDLMMGGDAFEPTLIPLQSTIRNMWNVAKTIRSKATDDEKMTSKDYLDVGDAIMTFAGDFMSTPYEPGKRFLTGAYGTTTGEENWRRAFGYSNYSIETKSNLFGTDYRGYKAMLSESKKMLYNKKQRSNLENKIDEAYKKGEITIKDKMRYMRQFERNQRELRRK